MATEAEVTPIAREILDTEGDVLIHTSLNELLVSSKILILSSSVFKTMLQSQFREGSPRSASHPLHLALPDDNHEALTITLKVLHFQRAKIVEDPTAIQLLDVSMLCDKYDLVGSMQSAMLQWVGKSFFETDPNVATLQRLSLANMIMGLDKEFSRSTRAWILNGTEERECVFEDVHYFDILQDNVRRERENMMVSLLTIIEEAILNLSSSDKFFETKEKRCVGCNMSKPLETKRCGHCRGEAFVAITCSAGMRVCELIQKLNRTNLFPLVKQAGQSPVAFLELVKTIPVHAHSCWGDNACPLIIEFGQLKRRIESCIAVFAGLCLEDVRSAEAPK